MGVFISGLRQASTNVLGSREVIMQNTKLKALLTKHAAIIAATGRELAMNFDIPARDIIGMACADMGISREQWDALQSYRIAKEQSA